MKDLRTSRVAMGSRSGSGSWEGHAELQQALEGLACAKGTSANRVKAVATAALRYAKVRISSFNA